LLLYPELMSFIIHERDQDDNDIERYTKRVKLDQDDDTSESDASEDHILPPSHALLKIPLPVVKEGQPLNFREPDVGISEYIGSGGARIEGIIKQRSVSSTSWKLLKYVLTQVGAGSLTFWSLKSI